MADDPLHTQSMSWQVQLKECVVSSEGRVEELFILKGPTYPCEFYVGPVILNTIEDVMPRWNSTCYYHRTEDEALAAMIEMRERHIKRAASGSGS